VARGPLPPACQASARESLKRAQQALADLEDDEARRAGALPGWLR